MFRHCYLEDSLVARLDADVATDEVVGHDMAVVINVDELLSGPVLSQAIVGSNLADAPGDTALALRALDRAPTRELEPVGADGPHFLHWRRDDQVDAAVPIGASVSESPSAAERGAACHRTTCTSADQSRTGSCHNKLAHAGSHGLVHPQAEERSQGGGYVH